MASQLVAKEVAELLKNVDTCSVSLKGQVQATTIISNRDRFRRRRGERPHDTLIRLAKSAVSHGEASRVGGSAGISPMR